MQNNSNQKSPAVPKLPEITEENSPFVTITGTPAEAIIRAAVFGKPKDSFKKALPGRAIKISIAATVQADIEALGM